MNKKVENANVVSEDKKITEDQLKELQGHAFDLWYFLS